MSNKIEIILDLYFNHNKSTVEIAKAIHSSPKVVRDAILRAGKSLRSKKQATQLSYKKGRRPPMTGRVHTTEGKKKISESVHKNWSELSPENYKKRVDNCRERWYTLDSSVREKIYSLARKSLANTAREGSKLERECIEFLSANNLAPVMHYKGFPNETLEVDIVLPANKIAIEIDGPSHFIPIYGEERLSKTIESDEKKNLLLLGYGYVIIRCGFINEITKYKRKKFVKNLLDLVRSIIKEFPVEGKRLIQMEIK